jgi:citronellol/citronellal dehydrogenase
MKLQGKVAIVTGSSRGLGKAISLGLAKEGANIVVTARTEVENPQLPGTIQKTVEEIQTLKQQALPIKCDVSSE